ncbi:unnamed protein product [Mytilus edulis]|uniref:Uncharacterized protein n=1 Tax=Mytilus edulis TaxID=6550 RepID=A0A8S3QL59_MYTED|nr:unnamed protein product [Mytilus edulis]
MNFKFVIAWSSLWLPLTIGQGCPYSRTVVPGDAKRYIEMVHNIAHERHCAPGTEFDPTTCECSLLSSGAWSPGLAFIDGLATAYPELANMPLDVLQKEILLLSSPTMYPTNVNSVPSSFQKPTRLNNQRKQQIDMFSPSSLNTQQILDLFQNVRPEDIPPDVLNDLEHLMFWKMVLLDQTLFQHRMYLLICRQDPIMRERSFQHKMNMWLEHLGICVLKIRASQPSIQGTDHNRPKSKRRKSKTAEFSYKPAQNGISSQSYDLLSLLSGKPTLELIPSRKVSTPVEKSTPQLRGLSQTIPNNSPKLDLFFSEQLVLNPKYSMMKEGASDAQEIMQDRMTEMGGVGALAMGIPMSAMNSEVKDLS